MKRATCQKRRWSLITSANVGTSVAAFSSLHGKGWGAQQEPTSSNEQSTVNDWRQQQKEERRRTCIHPRRQRAERLEIWPTIGQPISKPSRTRRPRSPACDDPSCVRSSFAQLESNKLMMINWPGFTQLCKNHHWLESIDFKRCPAPRLPLSCDDERFLKEKRRIECY